MFHGLFSPFIVLDSVFITSFCLNPKNTSTKLQINLKLQYSMTKISLQRFGILNFGHCDLFDICVLLFTVNISRAAFHGWKKPAMV